jgi:precorrin-4 methylase
VLGGVAEECDELEAERVDVNIVAGVGSKQEQVLETSGEQYAET